MTADGPDLTLTGVLRIYPHFLGQRMPHQLFLFPDLVLR